MGALRLAHWRHSPASPAPAFSTAPLSAHAPLTYHYSCTTHATGTPATRGRGRGRRALPGAADCFPSTPDLHLGHSDAQFSACCGRRTCRLGNLSHATSQTTMSAAWHCIMPGLKHPQLHPIWIDTSANADALRLYFGAAARQTRAVLAATTYTCSALPAKHLSAGAAPPLAGDTHARANAAHPITARGVTYA